MGIKEKLEGRVPNNESAAYLRRTKLRFEQGKDADIKDAQMVLLDAGVFDILEELLETVQGSSFDFSRYPHKRNHFVYSRFDIGMAMKDFLGSFEPVTVSLRFSWNNRAEEPQFDFDEDDLVSDSLRERLEITSQAGSNDITVQTSSDYSDFYRRAPLLLSSPLPSDSKAYKWKLSPEQWRNRDKLEQVITEALTLAGLTRSDLR